jgi:glycosyltransferase involved in cell wall biosynthesis
MVKALIKRTVFYQPMAKLYDWFHFYFRFIEELIRILFIPNETHAFFFFPFYHTGGAELVHLNIVKAIKCKTVTFFTLPSANSHFLFEFQENSECHLIEKMIRKSWHRKLFFRCISYKINHRKNATVFGCHSLFFYELLPYLNKGVQCIDLLHAFTHADEPGFEKVSLPYVNRLNKRVTISQKGKNDLLEQYKASQIPIELRNRIEVIYNSTDFTCEEIPIKATDVFNVVYVGRNSPEKRISLIGKIATELKKMDSAFNFIFVGEDLEQGVNPEDRGACSFVGNITLIKELEKIYRAAHVVLIASTREGIPMALVEGMVFGAIPVSIDVGGISELIEQDVTGKLIPEESGDFVSEFLNIFSQLKENESICRKLSQNGALKVNLFFNNSLFNRKYNTLLNAKSN